MNYCQVSFYTSNDELRGRLVAILDEAGFTAFEETDDALLAFIPQDDRAGISLEELLPEPVRWEEKVLRQQNWNALWESSFEPVSVPGFCTVRAEFHPADPDVPHDIIITPKMSFGTGHHATTRLMMQTMKEMDFSGVRVLDFGTGTGILAILAHRLGAAGVLAIDNDSWSVENALENVAANGADSIGILQGSIDAVAAEPVFDVILANINRHILLAHMGRMGRMLSPSGTLVLSGIFAADQEIICTAATEAGLKKDNVLGEGDWISIKFSVYSAPESR